jgi:hypothetical protein
MKTNFDANLLLGATKQAPDAQRAIQDKAALKKACQDFEAIFIQSLFKAMRKTVPDGGIFTTNRDLPGNARPGNCHHHLPETKRRSGRSDLPTNGKKTPSPEVIPCPTSFFLKKIFYLDKVFLCCCRYSVNRKNNLLLQTDQDGSEHCREADKW